MATRSAITKKVTRSVIDTIGDTRPSSTIPTPHTDKLHTVERYKLIEGGKAIEISIEVETPGLSTKWTARQRWVSPAGALMEVHCNENQRRPLQSLSRAEPEGGEAGFLTLLQKENRCRDSLCGRISRCLCASMLLSPSAGVSQSTPKHPSSTPSSGRPGWKSAMSPPAAERPCAGVNDPRYPYIDNGRARRESKQPHLSRRRPVQSDPPGLGERR